MFNKEVVEHISKLSRLSLKDQDIEVYTVQFSKILDYINKLNEVDTSQVTPTFQVTGLTNIERDDILCQSESREAFLDAAPQKQDGLFKVKFTS